jgi:tRNA (cmo5U34)-methyltransferase
MSEQADRVWQSAEVAHGYLEGMRGAIPLAAEQLDVMIRVIRAARPELTTFMDIGCGDGILGHTLLAHYPDAQGVLLDFSEPMIEAARHKLATSRMQLQFICEDYGKSGWVKSATIYSPFDAIVSGFSIHHQPDIRKQTLYAEIYHLLKPGGIFINIEHVSPENLWMEDRFNELFIDSMVAHNQRHNVDISPEETAKRYYEREHKDANILAPLETQLGWMRDIGFQQVTCYLKIFELAVFGGIRPNA